MPLIQKQNFSSTDTIRASFHHERYRKAIHMHQFAEIVYILEGEMQVKTAGKEKLAKAGDLIVIYPYQYHGFYTENDKTTKLWMILFSDTLIMDLVKTDTEYTEYEDAVFTPSPALRTFIESKMINTQEKRCELSAEERRHIKALLYPIFDEYLNNATTSNVSAKKNSDIINSTLKYVKYNFFKEITISDCSKTIGYSKSHISHCLSESLGITFTELRNSFRIDYAKSLLNNNNTSVFNVGLECGFNCERSFERAFKKEVGLTPNQYRLRKTR